MLVYIAGAGAMGCRFGYQISQTNNEVILLDNWDAHIDAIKTNGLHIVGDEDKIVPMNIMKAAEATKTADLIILFTKAMQLDKMLSDIKQIIGENTKVLCLLNGLGHEEVIRKYVKETNILMGVTVWTAGLKGPGTALISGTGSINLQSLNPSGKDEGEDITALLNEAKLNATYDENVLPSIWRKACVNGTMNSTCALLDCTIGEFFATETGVELVKNIIHEFVIVGIAEGIELNEQEIVDYVLKVSVAAAAHYPSMHQDLVQNKRFTEIDYINGAIYQKGKKHHIDTPYCHMITNLIHSKELITKVK